MSLTRLRYFCVVAETENMTRAAERLHITQPSLSRHITRLEQDLGTPLFDRTPTRMTLNAYGRLYLPYVKEALALLERGHAKVQEAAGAEIPALRIISTFVGLPSIMLERYYLEHPDHVLRINHCSTREAAPLLLEGKVDFVISLFPFEHPPQVAQEIIGSEDIVVEFPPDRTLPNASINLREYAGERFFLLENDLDMHEIIRTICGNAAFTPNVVYESDDAHRIPEMLDAAGALTFNPCHKAFDICQHDSHSLPRFRAVNSPKCSRTFYLSYFKDTLMSPNCRLFYEYTLNFFTRMQAELDACAAQFRR